MIVYDLACADEHRFEAWFASSEDFERQAGTPLLVCPVCSNAEIRRVPSGVNIGRHGRGDSTAQGSSDDPGSGGGDQGSDHVAAFSNPKDLLKALRKVMSAAENVGERFPEEARRIHYGEAPKRSIRGQASREDAAALREEGIEVLSLPIPPTEDLH
jgi:hypothetical protein